MNVHIKSKKNWHGCSFGELKARHYIKGEVYEVTIDIDEELAMVAIREGWAERFITDEYRKACEVEENKLMTAQENKAVILDRISTLPYKPEKKKKRSVTKKAK